MKAFDAWKIKDRKGLEKFYLLISKEIDVISDTGSASRRNYSNQRANSLPVARRVEPKKAELAAAQQWLLSLAESSIRKIVSKTSVASVISSRASQYLHASNNQSNPNRAVPQTELQLSNNDVESPATPDSLGIELRAMLSPEAAAYGLEIERIEVQEIQMPKDIQDAIDRVWKASLLPAQSTQEAAARYNHIKAELEAVKDVIGIDAASIDHVLKNFKGTTIYGGMPKILEQLLAKAVAPTAKAIAKGEEVKKAKLI